MVQTNKVALEIALHDVGGNSAVVANTTHFTLEVFNTVECAFAFATRVGAGQKARTPPLVGVFNKKAVDDAVDKRGGDDFASDGVVDDKGDATAWVVGAGDNRITQADEIFEIIGFEIMLVHGFAFAADAGFIIGLEKLSE